MRMCNPVGHPMNKPVRPETVTAHSSRMSVDELLRGFYSTMSYRTLEPRMAFDGAAAATAAAVADQPASDATAGSGVEPAATDSNQQADVAAAASAPAGDASATEPSASDLLTMAAAGPAAAPNGPVTIVFIDQHVENIAQIVSQIDASAEIILIDDNSSGLEQIASHLAGRTDIGSIHIVSHGSAGTLYLGNEVITTESLSDYQAQLTAIGQALSETGDILIYGCDIGRGLDGDAFIKAFADKTSADVAASIDVTGAADLGGDWVLEASAGAIETSALQLQSWEGRLAPGTAILDWQLVGNHTFGAAGTTYTIGALTNAVTIRTTGTGTITNDSTFATGGTGDPGLQLRAQTTSTTAGQTTEIIFNAGAFPLGVITAQFDLRNIDAGTWDDRVIVQAYDINGVLLVGANITATPRQVAGQTYSITNLANGKQFDGNIDGASDNAPYDTVGLSITS